MRVLCKLWAGIDEFGMIFRMEHDWMVGYIYIYIYIYILAWDWFAW